MTASTSVKAPVLDVKILYPAIFSLLLISAAYAGEKAPLYPLANPPALNGGVVYDFYRAPGNFVSEMFAVPPESSGSINLSGPVTSFGKNYHDDGNGGGPNNSSFDLGFLSGSTDNFGVRYVTLLRVATAGTYTFYTSSDDGSVLYIGDGNDREYVVGNDGPHGQQTNSGTIELAAGYHRMTVEYKQGGADYGISVGWRIPGEPDVDPPVSIPNDVLFIEPLNESPAIASTPAADAVSESYAVTLSGPAGGTIRYTLNGGEPSSFSDIYTAPLNITEDTVVRAKVFGLSKLPSHETHATFFIVKPTDMPPGQLSSGLFYQYYTTAQNDFIPWDINSRFPGKTGTMANVNDNAMRDTLPELFVDPEENQPQYYAIKWSGYINIPEDGFYTFTTHADDSSRLYIGDEMVIDNGGQYTGVDKEGTISLRTGLHRFTYIFAQGGGGHNNTLDWSGPGFGRESIPDERFLHFPISLAALPPSTNFGGQIVLVLQATPTNATIYWTTDGSTPTPTNATGSGIGPIFISKTTNLRAIAVVGDETPAMISETYTQVQPQATLSGALASGINTEVFVSFASPIDGASITDPAGQFAIDGGVTVSAAVVDPTDPFRVLLTTSAMDDDEKYTLTVNGVAPLGGPAVATQTIPFKYYPKGSVTSEYFDFFFESNPPALGEFINVSDNYKNNTPGVVAFPTSFESTISQGFGFGQRFRAFYFPPVSGDIRFVLAASNQASLKIATDGNPTHIGNGNTGYGDIFVYRSLGNRQWDVGTGEQMNFQVERSLTANSRVFLEGLQAASDTAQNYALLAIEKNTPYANGDAPTSGAQLSPVVYGPVFTKQPEKRIVVKGDLAIFSTQVQGTGVMQYKWQKNGNDIPVNWNMLYVSSMDPTAPGLYRCVATNDAGTSFSQEVELIVIDPASPPLIASITPELGPVAGGTSVTITGSGFLPGNTQVFFGGTPVGFANVSTDGTTITCSTPSSGAGLSSVTVKVFGQTEDTLADAFTFVPTPTITNVSPSFGPITGTDGVTLTGTGFVAGLTMLTIDDAPLTILAESPTQLTFDLPANAAGAVTLKVATPGGNASSSFTYFGNPTVTGATPSRGATAGGNTITIAGTSFITGQTAVTIGGTPALNVTVLNNSTLSVVVPPGTSGPADIAVATFGGQLTGTLAAGYLYTSAPTATAQTVMVGEDQSVEFTLAGVSPDNLPLTFELVSPPQRGALAGTAPTFTYFPEPGFFGTDSLSFRAKDGVLSSAPAAVTFVVKPKPRPTSAPALSPNPALINQTVTGTVGAGNNLASWNWGDGSPVVAGETVTHAYATPGIYSVAVTLTSEDNLTQSFTLDIFVGDGSNGGGANPPGVTGVLIGGNGLGKKQGGSGTLSVSYMKREKSAMSGSIGMLTLPGTLTQDSLTNMMGWLSIGNSTKSAKFQFMLTKTGKAKASGLPGVELSLKKKTFKFKAQRADLTDVIEALGAPQVFAKKKTDPVQLYVPASVQIGNNIFLAMTFQFTYTQTNGKGTGKLTVIK